MSAKTTALLRGARDTVPMLIGALPFGLIFGTLAVASGLSLPATLLMSALVFAGSAQFIAVSLIASGTGLVVLLLTTLIVNLRHMLYSASLMPHVRHLPQRWKIPLAFWLTDESFAVVHRHYLDPHPPKELKHWYYLGSCLAMYSNWFLCTARCWATRCRGWLIGGWILPWSRPLPASWYRCCALARCCWRRWSPAWLRCWRMTCHGSSG